MGSYLATSLKEKLILVNVNREERIDAAFVTYSD